VYATKTALFIVTALLVTLGFPIVAADGGGPPACGYSDPEPIPIGPVQGVPDYWEDFVGLWRGTGFAETVDFGTAAYRDLVNEGPIQPCEKYTMLFLSCSSESDSCQVAIVRNTS
jgi:hypothetical protein